MADFSNILTKSYTGQNLLNISLTQDNSPNYKDYMSKYFAFVTMAPGTTGEKRTYNFDSRITLKTDLDKLMALAKSLQLCAQYIVDHEKDSKNPTFSIFTDPSKSNFGGSGGLKLLQTTIFEQKGIYKVALSIKEGDIKPFGLSWSAAEAMAVGISIEKIALEGMDMDIKYKKDHPFRPSGGGDSGGSKSSRPSTPSGSSDDFGGDFISTDDMPF